MAEQENYGRRPMSAAPKNGVQVVVFVELSGRIVCHLAHFAEGGGEEQPRYGPGWFFWNGYLYDEIKKPLGWIPIPEGD